MKAITSNTFLRIELKSASRNLEPSMISFRRPMAMHQVSIEEVLQCTVEADAVFLADDPVSLVFE